MCECRTPVLPKDETGGGGEDVVSEPCSSSRQRVLGANSKLVLTLSVCARDCKRVIRVGQFVTLDGEWRFSQRLVVICYGEDVGLTPQYDGSERVHSPGDLAIHEGRCKRWC